MINSHVRERSDKQTWIESGEGFVVHSSTWPSGAKGKWRGSSWLVISNIFEKVPNFTCVVTAFLRAGIPYIIPWFIWQKKNTSAWAHRVSVSCTLYKDVGAFIYFKLREKIVWLLDNYVHEENLRELFIIIQLQRARLSISLCVSSKQPRSIKQQF